MLTSISVFSAGCSATSGTKPVGNFCDVARPIYLTQDAVHALSSERKRTILAHNEFGEKACGWRAAK